jgi:creatinine amidohydrolase/Fe(II)-dependent formamide hydrolase-like protein
VTLRDDPAAGDGYSRTGASGDPTLASAGKGVAILGAMVRDLVDGLRVRHPDAPGVR